MNFPAFADDIIAGGWNVFGAEVYRADKPVFSFGDTFQNRHPIYSATKTVTSIAVGMAAADGKLDIEKSVLDYMPGKFSAGMTALQRETYRKITIKRLLTMSVAGYPFRPEGESWLETALAHPLPDAEKPVFAYSNISAYLVGVAAANALDEDLYEFLCRRLFAPLEIENPPCGRCPDGYFYGASHMELSVNELSRIGLLMKNGGVYGGQRLIPEEYIRAAVSLQQQNREGGYGYFVWKYRGGFSINGKWQQKCYVLPEKDMMVTYLSHIEEKTPALKASMERNVFGIE